MDKETLNRVLDQVKFVGQLSEPVDRLSILAVWILVHLDPEITYHQLKAQLAIIHPTQKREFP
jgi:hypothetical protein